MRTLQDPGKFTHGKTWIGQREKAVAISECRLLSARYTCKQLLDQNVMTSNMNSLNSKDI